MSTSMHISWVPCKKSQKTGCDEQLSLSDLPDWAISHILSRLPTKDAVRTSVLSKDWEYKWTSIYNLELNDRMSSKKGRKATFANFVERTLFRAQSVQSLSLSCYKNYDLDRMKTWMLVALSHDVQCLTIDCPKASIVLPRNLLNRDSLRKLDLRMRCTFKVPAEICFLQLKTLYLEEVVISNELSNFDVVKFKFPVLETFTLTRCKWLNVKFVEINAPNMTSFEYETADDSGVSDYSIKITGDSSVRFRSHGFLLGNIFLSGPKVVYANMHGMYGCNYLRSLEKRGLQIRKLLNEFTSLKELELSGLIAKAITQAKLGVPLPRYYDMERLVLYSFGTVEALFQILHVAPSLKFLVICVAGWSGYDYDEEYIPSCSLLEEINFEEFGGEKNELKLAKLFLKNAIQLKRVYLSIRDYPRLPKNEITEELSAYPTASTCVNITVT